MTDAGHQLQVGGTLNPRRHIYITRQDVEDEIHALLVRQEYCNILSSRQVGKSSLMVQLALRLRADGIRVATVDVAGDLGTPDVDEKWILGFLGKVARGLRLSIDVREWWASQSEATVNQRFLEFFRTQLIADDDDSPVVIFVDEIDHTLKLAYTDDFFTAIRSMYNQRATEPVFERIAFCLVGVASPNELIKSRRTTTYNVGRTCALRDFDPAKDDLGPLVAYLTERSAAPDRLLEEILRWTAGHPYLTVLLCHACHEQQFSDVGKLSNYVEHAYSGFGKVRSDVHFQQITRFLGERLTDQFAALDVYDQVLRQGDVTDESTPTHIELKLSGIVKQDRAGNLTVRNRIYERVFNREWVRQTRPSQALRNARRLAVVSVLLLMLVGSAFAYDHFVAEPRRNRALAEKLVAEILDAQTPMPEVPTIIRSLEPVFRYAEPVIRQATNSEDDGTKLRANLALLPTDAAAVEPLLQHLVRGRLADFAVVSQALRPYSDEVKRYSQIVLQADDSTANEQLRAAMALAPIEAPEDNDEAMWTERAEVLAGEMIRVTQEQPVLYSTVIEALQPARGVLRTSLVAAYREDSDSGQAERATISPNILVHLFRDDFGLLVELLRDAAPPQAAIVFPALLEHDDFQPAPLRAVIIERDRYASWQRANAAVALLRTGGGMLQSARYTILSDPTLQSHIIVRYRASGGEILPVARQLEVEDDPTMVRVLTLIVGEFQRNAALQAEFVASDVLSKLFEYSPEPGIHSAAEWALGHSRVDTNVHGWQNPLIVGTRNRLATGKIEDSRRWYITKSEYTVDEEVVSVLPHTMLVIKGQEFMMGSPESEEGRGDDEVLHRRIVNRTFALSSTMVTMMQYRAFQPEEDFGSEQLMWERPESLTWEFFLRPATVPWCQAAAYCNWLSKHEGLPKTEWCYEPNDEGHYDEGMRTKANFLQLGGYRLPTEAEWEFACRANTATPYSFGDTPELEMLWGSVRIRFANPVAEYRPNSFGLFDMHGNGMEWCQTVYGDYPADGATDEEEGGVVTNVYDTGRVVRGGTLLEGANALRSARRSGIPPVYSMCYRIARTVREP